MGERRNLYWEKGKTSIREMRDQWKRKDLRKMEAIIVGVRRDQCQGDGGMGNQCEGHTEALEVSAPSMPCDPGGLAHGHVRVGLGPDGKC